MWVKFDRLFCDLADRHDHFFHENSTVTRNLIVLQHPQGNILKNVWIFGGSESVLFSEMVTQIRVGGGSWEGSFAGDLKIN